MTHVETDPRVATLVLAGGSGRRLWPLSHRERPKPLLDWLDGATMLDATLARTPPWCDPSRVFVSVPRESEGVFREALGAHPDVALLVEPEARDTGPALAWAMAEIEARVGPCVVLVVAADHAVRDVAALHAALKYGKLDALLQKGLCVVERAATLGRGSIGDYAIESDTVSDVLLECMEGPARERLAGVLEHPTSDEVRRHKGGSLPLRNAADFLETTGEALRALLQRHANVDVRGERAWCAQRSATAGSSSRCARATGRRSASRRRRWSRPSGESNDSTRSSLYRSPPG